MELGARPQRRLACDPWKISKRDTSACRRTAQTAREAACSAVIGRAANLSSAGNPPCRRPRAAIQANEAFMGCSMSYKKDERHSPKTRQNHVPGPFHETLKEYEAHRPTTALRADTARARPPWRAPSPKFLGWVRHASYCKRDRIQTAKHHSLSRRGPEHGPLTVEALLEGGLYSCSCNLVGQGQTDRLRVGPPEPVA